MLFSLLPARCIFCSFPPRYSIAQVVTRFKSLSARAIFREFPRIKRRLWGGERWEDGYFVRTVGDKVTAEVIRRYIQQHRLEKSGDAQLSLSWLRVFTCANTT